jgi:iron only hydrogenase large subunit-like protein/uncharacterized Fe-S cluster-containing protein
MPEPIVNTTKAHCRDCYRCLRECPVKAIRIVDGQASVDAERCIHCGTCVRECPQGAKSLRSDLERAAGLLKSGGFAAASVAPSFAAFLPENLQRRLPDALRKLGFARVSETAVGAFHVARASADHIRTNPEAVHIASACPAVVSYVEQYEPDMVDALIPVVSPMAAHGRSLKEQHGPDCKVVFIGPCSAKKSEAERPELADAVDCVLTFTELFEWLELQGIDLDDCADTDFDDRPEGDARFFPVPGGLARTAELTTDLLAAEVLAVSGPAEIHDALENVRENPRPVLVEPLFCAQGCVNGAGAPQQGNLYKRRGDVLQYARRPCSGESAACASCASEAPAPANGDGSLKTRFDRRNGQAELREEDIKRVLESTGKADAADQLNCGACGYSSCRAQAIAVLQGMASVDMCIPHMRRLAEQRSDKIIETTPNGIVMLDEQLNILHMNPAFRKMFMATEAVLGKPVSYLMDPEPFENLQREGELMEFTARHPNYGVVCRQILYPLPEERQYVGVFVNVTKSMDNEKRLRRMRADTVRKAQELMEHQIQAAQEMAKFLGESTAETEDLVRNLMSIASEKTPESGDHWLWDTDTST